MRRILAWQLAVLVLLGACGKRPGAPAGSAPQKAPEQAITEVKAAAPEPVAVETPEISAPQETDVQAADAAIPAPAVDPAMRERIVVYTLGRPSIVELHLTIDGQPHSAALERLVDEVLKVGDTDGDGRTMWKELCESKRIKYGQYGNLAIDNEDSEKQIIERYDIARDGVVDRQELPRFLTRNAGGSRPFSVRGTFGYRNSSRRSAPIWKAIDVDDDGRLSSDEVSRAGTRLAAFDADDDEILVADDFRERDLPPGMMEMRERRRGLEAARLLGEHADWGSVQQAMEHHYGGGRFLRTGAFRLGADLFETLDANDDGRLGRDEYRGLESVPADVVIEVGFGRASEDAPQEPRLKLVQANLPGGSAGDAATERAGRLTIALGGSLVMFYTNDTVGGDNFSARAMQTLAMFDQNKDGYLEPGELPEALQRQFARFEAVDADENGKVYPEEIEEFLAEQQAGLRAQIHARVEDQEEVLFTHLDVDGDGRLTSRELQSAGARLQTLDRDQSGDVSPDELPEVLLVALARGSIENADATFAMRSAAGPELDKEAPRWFTSMDANQDGEISRREFLGTGDQFARLDASGDGLLQVAEAKAADEGPSP